MKKLSLLDKLIDTEPDTPAEIHKTQQQQLSDLYDSIHRDLENLLNTRKLDFIPANNDNLSFSLLNYGLPDLFNHPPSLLYQNEFIQKLRLIIEIFETRLNDIEISLLPHDEVKERTLRFRITGWINIDSAPTLMSLHTTLNPENYSFQLTPS